MKEIAVDIEGFSVNSMGAYWNLMAMLEQSQLLAVKEFGRTALAIYQVERQYGTPEE